MAGVPGRGERIGSAFVRVFFTGDNQGLKDAFDDPELVKDAEESGKELGEAQGEARNEAWVQKLREAVEEEDQINAESNRHFGASMAARKGVITNLTNRIGEDLHEINVEFLRFDAISESTRANMEALANEIENGHRQASLIDDKFRDVDRTVNQTNTEVGRFSGLIERVNDDIDSLNDEFTHGNILLGQFGNKWSFTNDEIEKFGVTTERNTHRMRGFITQVEKLGDRTEKFGHDFDDLAFATGRLFGLGSRNNLLNFIGAVTKNIIRSFAFIFTAVGKVVNLISDSLVKGMEETGEAAEGAAKSSSGLLSSLAAGLPAIIAGLALVTVGFLALGESLSLVAALISGIAAALVALAGSLAFALVGALAAVAGALLPIALGVGAVVLALATMSDKAKKALGEDLKPLLATVRDLGDAFREGFGEGVGSALDRGIARLQLLRPLFEDIGRVVGDLTRRFNNLFDKPALHELMDQLTIFIPDALNLLGRAILNTIRGLASLFTASIPEARNFLDFLVRITREFRQWAHQNPQAIRKFLDEAAESAQTLLDLIGAIGDTINIVFFSGRDTGDSIIARLTKNI